MARHALGRFETILGKADSEILPRHGGIGLRSRALEAIRPSQRCGYHLFIRQRSSSYPDILMMQAADMLELSHGALATRLDVSSTGSVLG